MSAQPITLVLLPGLDGSGDLFEPFVSAMGSKYKFVVVRYPADGPQSYEELEVFVRERLPASEPFILLGESFSGPVAISISSAPPANMMATVLCATFARNPRPRLASLRWALPLANHRLAPMVLATALLMGRQSTPALRAALRTSLAKLEPPVFRARLRAVLSADVMSKLASVNRPILYLQALQDQLVPSAATDAVRQKNLNVQVVGVDGPHFLLQVCPTETASAVGTFLAETKHAI